MSDAMMQLDGLVRHFDGVRAVDEVSFSVERGTVLGFIGPNGAGKTTTMRILATLDSPQRGDARIGGYSVVDEPAKVRRITGFMPDYAGVYANTTVVEYLDFFARAYDLRGPARREAVANIVEFLGIGDLEDRNVESLSKGLKQRVALGRALIHDPQVLILDEPAANLDPRARIEFRTLIRELAADGKTVLLSSHILTELSEMCDVVAVIEKGRILATGTVPAILQRLRSRRTLSVRVCGGQRRAGAFPGRTAGRRERARAGRAPAVRARRRRRRSGGADRAPRGRGLSGARVQRAQRRSRGSVHRDHRRARAMSRAEAVLGWLEDKSDWLSPMVVKEVRQIVRGQEFAYSFGISLLASVAVAFFGAADALSGNPHIRELDLHRADGLPDAVRRGGRSARRVQRAAQRADGADAGADHVDGAVAPPGRGREAAGARCEAGDAVLGHRRRSSP